MTAFRTYEPSGKYSPAAFGIAPAFGIAAGLVLGFIYVKIIDWIPNIWIGAVACVFFAFATGVAAGFGLKLAKCRNNTIGMAMGASAGLVALFFTYIWTYMALKDQVMASMVAEFGAEEAGRSMAGVGFSEVMGWRTEFGWVIGSESGVNITGGLVYLIWLIEAAIVIGCSTIAPLIFTAAPFCEETGTWAKKQKMGEVRGINPDAFNQAAESGDMAGIVSPLGEVNSIFRAYYELYACQGGNMYLTAKLAYKDKENKEQQDDVVDYIYIDAVALEGLQHSLKNGPRRPAPRKPKELPGKLRTKPGQSPAPQQAAPMAAQPVQQQPPRAAGPTAGQQRRPAPAGQRPVQQRPAPGQKPRLPSRRTK